MWLCPGFALTEFLVRTKRVPAAGWTWDLLSKLLSILFSLRVCSFSDLPVLTALQVAPFLLDRWQHLHFSSQQI